MCYFTTHQQRRRVKLTPEETSDFYAEHYGKPDFSSMIAYMSKAPIVALVLAKGPETVAEWSDLIGQSRALSACCVAVSSSRTVHQ